MSKFCKHCDTSHADSVEFWTPAGRCRQKNRDYYQNERKEALSRAKEYQVVNKAKVSEYALSYYHENNDKIRARNKIRRQVNNEAVNAAQRKYREKNKDKLNLQKRERHAKNQAENTNYRLATSLRRRARNAITKGRPGSGVGDLGCSISELKVYIEQQFRDGMSWDNYGKVWHLDHVLPLANYQLSDRGTFKRLCHYTNLQPLLARENLAKGSKEDINFGKKPE